jgi:hypothetical protein
MTTLNTIAVQWPALDFEATTPPDRIAYQRGVWGKAHGASSDFRWLATTKGFSAPRHGLQHELPLGSEDTPVTASLWRVAGDTCYAVSLYPSQASDATGRSGFVEKNIIEWTRPRDVPSILGALMLLPLTSPTVSDWWEKRSDVMWSEEDRMLDLPDPPSLIVSQEAIDDAIGRGLRSLVAATSEEALSDLYAKVLAGHRTVALSYLQKPLSPEAIAALLLPLPREIADACSIAGWLPSVSLSASAREEVRRCWNIVLGGLSESRTGEFIEPTADQTRAGREMAAAVFANVPAQRKQPITNRSVNLALWGPSAAGKTAIIAELFLERDSDERWEVLPTGKSLNFIKTMRDRIQTRNFFPPASTIGHIDEITYEFSHRRSNVTALLHLEDRAGHESEHLDEAPTGKVSLRQRLSSADGLVLVFDSQANVAHLNARVSNALELIYVARNRAGQKDERPIAVCFSKADAMIRTAADLRHAVDDPDTFVREHIDSRLLDSLDRLCANYMLFPVSAAGVRLRHGSIEPVVFFDESLEPRICPGGRTLNLMAPFSWVLNQLTGVA